LPPGQMHFGNIGLLFGNGCLTQRIGRALVSGVEGAKNWGRVWRCSWHHISIEQLPHRIAIWNQS
jgi:hypothetical protein